MNYYYNTKEAILFLLGIGRKEWHVAYNYMVMTLTHAARTLKNDNCNERVITMYQDNCSKVILDWYGIATR
jgi:hypothetical protein